MQSYNFDITVVGGGMVGALAAIAMAKAGFEVCVLEPGNFGSQDYIDVDFRGLALSNVTLDLLSKIGVWPELSKYANPINKVHVSEKNSTGTILFDAKEEGEKQLGSVIEGGTLTKVLQQSALKLKNVTVYDSFDPSDLGYEFLLNEKIWQVRKKDKIINSRLVIAADGTKSRFRDHVKIPVTTRDFSSYAVVRNIQLGHKHNNVAYERFTKFGALALVPYSNDCMKSIWIVSKDQRDTLLSSSDEEYSASIINALPRKVLEAKVISKTLCYPLIQTKSLRLTSMQSVLLGNAALTVHPIAAQGFNLAARDVFALQEILIENKDAFYSGSTLFEYECWRKPEHDKVIDSIVKIIEVSSNNNLGLVRALGRVAFQLSPTLKKTLLNHMMGKNERLPRLCTL